MSSAVSKTRVLAKGLKRKVLDCGLKLVSKTKVNLSFGLKPDFCCGLSFGLKLQFKTKVLAEKLSLTCLNDFSCRERRFMWQSVFIELRMFSFTATLVTSKKQTEITTFLYYLYYAVLCDFQYNQIDKVTPVIHFVTCVTDHFYRAMLCIRGTSHAPVSVRVRPSVTSRSSTKTAERIGLVFGM